VVGKGVINSPKIENRTFAHNAAKQEKEPMLQDFCFAANVGCQEAVKNLQQGLGFGTRFLVASNEVVCTCAKNETFWHGVTL